MTRCQCCDLSPLLPDLRAVWPDGSAFAHTEDLITWLVERFPERWSASSHFGRDLTPQRMGRYLAQQHGVQSGRDHTAHRGYCLADMEEIW